MAVPSSSAAERREEPPGALGDERGIRADADEREPELEVARNDGGVVDEDARGLALRPARGDDAVQRAEVVGVLELARDPEGVGQVRRADEQDVDPVDRGDLVGVAQAADRFDLDDSDDTLVQAMNVRVADDPEARAADPGRDARKIPSGG